ncbi:hypothetical protein LG296_07270 [Ureibacillus chungkukjangi]|uniref:type II secretion system protein n=1 Tax=Ureibacillus chungkukjangi TaxID=1202712 RepID=UPI003850F66E
MNKNYLNNKGLTLVELLAVIILISFIGIFSFSLIVQSTETTRQIQIESNMRDEADIIVSQLMKTLYETRQNQIIENQTGTGFSYLNVTTDPSKCRRDEITGAWIVDQPCRNTFEKIGFETQGTTTRLIIKGESYHISNTNIKILNDSKIIGNPTSQNSYEILLKLEYSGRKETSKSMEFKNIIQPF